MSNVKQMVMPQSYQPMHHRHFNESANPDMPPQPVKLDVQRIEEASCSYDDVIMVKLTEEMMKVLEDAQKTSEGRRMQITVNELGGVIDLGQGSSFRFQKQSVPGACDALMRTESGRVKNLGSCSKRYQVQATEKSFEDTRKRAEKRAEEEKNRGTRQVKQRQDGKVLNAPSLPSSKPHSTSTFNSKGSTSSGSSGTPSGGSSQGLNEQLRVELVRRPLRKRIIHLVVLRQFATWQDIYKRLRTEGLSQKEDVSERRICDIVREVSDSTAAGSALSLRTSLHSEVDPRWPFYTQDEKSMVRKLVTTQSNPTSDLSSSSFAPTRKKGMERMTASSKSSGAARMQPTTPLTGGSATTTTTPSTMNSGGSTVSSNASSRGQTVSPEVIPTPPTLSRPSSGAGVNSTNIASVTPKNATPTPTKQKVASPMSDEELLNYAQTQIGSKRKAHVPAHVVDDKRPRRQESASPPEDPTMRTPQPPQVNQNQTPSTVKQNPKIGTNGSVQKTSKPMAPPRVLLPPTRPDTITSHQNINNGGGSTASSNISSPASSVSSSPVTQDWEKTLTPVKNPDDAKKYTKIFNTEYPQYRYFYGILTKAADEFRGYEKRLRSATTQRDSAMVEKTIQDRFAYFEKDAEFVKARQRHADLRIKLRVLKQRLADWGVKVDKQ